MSEQQLIGNICKGDTASFRQLYRRYALSAYQFALSICKHKENAEEVVQNSFILVYKYLPSFKFQSSFKTWLLRIVFNESLRIQKLAKKYEWQDLNPDEYGNELIILKSPESVLQKETKEQVTKTLTLLQERESIVLRLFYLEELSIKEMAIVLNYTEGNVKVLLHRARKNFKRIYETM